RCSAGASEAPPNRTATTRALGEFAGQKVLFAELEDASGLHVGRRAPKRRDRFRRVRPAVFSGDRVLGWPLHPVDTIDEAAEISTNSHARGPSLESISHRLRFCSYARM